MPIRPYRYLHFDVFTDQRFGGNQLAIFPEAAGLPERTMQSIAREMNFAETTFVTPAVSPDSHVRMRIFTPAVELPMAGHPVIGSTFALAREGRIAPGNSRWVFGLNIGPLPLELEWRDGQLTFAWMTQPNPEFGSPLGDADTAAVAEAIGVPEQAIRSTGLPVQQVSCGVPFVIVPIATRAAVDAASPDARALTALARKEGAAHFSLYIFTTERTGADDPATVYSRMFAPGLGVYEDPATGGASGPLGSYLVRHSIVPPGKAGAILNLQGVKLGRPSWIHVSIESDGGAITRVRVGGTSVFVADGTFHVDTPFKEDASA
jgi:trans-2,3-dihydro-3-hydroxyanthranilate isomerase